MRIEYLKISLERRVLVHARKVWHLARTRSASLNWFCALGQEVFGLFLSLTSSDNPQAEAGWLMRADNYMLGRGI
jgi:hypothetical protein